MHAAAVGPASYSDFAVVRGFEVELDVLRECVPTVINGEDEAVFSVQKTTVQNIVLKERPQGFYYDVFGKGTLASRKGILFRGKRGVLFLLAQIGSKGFVSVGSRRD